MCHAVFGVYQGHNQKEFCSKFNLKPMSVSRLVRGISLKHKGWKKTKTGNN